MTRNYVKIIVLLGALAMLVSVADAKKQQWTIGTSQIAIADAANHAYVLSWQVPSSLEGLRIDHATLEFYVDADDNASDEHFQIRVAPAINVSAEYETYALVEDRSTTYASSGSGQNRRVVVDVMPAVRYWALEGGTAYSAILGEGVTDRAATLSTGNLGGSTVAKLTIWTSKR